MITLELLADRPAFFLGDENDPLLHSCNSPLTASLQTQTELENYFKTFSPNFICYLSVHILVILFIHSPLLVLLLFKAYETWYKEQV